MATCPEAREECAKFDTYLSINKYFDADPDIVSLSKLPLDTVIAHLYLGRNRCQYCYSVT